MLFVELATLNIVSTVCDWLKSDFLHFNAERLAKMLRYDLYYNYYTKCEGLENVNFVKARQEFDMNKIDEDILILKKNFSKY